MTYTPGWTILPRSRIIVTSRGKMSNQPDSGLDRSLSARCHRVSIDCEFVLCGRLRRDAEAWPDPCQRRPGAVVRRQDRQEGEGFVAVAATYEAVVFQAEPLHHFLVDDLGRDEP